MLDECTNNTTFYGGSDISYRYMLEGGKYLIIPTTMKPGVEREYCIRLFAAVDIACQLQEDQPGVFIRKEEIQFEHEGATHNCSQLTTIFGEWKEGVNAGGQIANRTFPSNPQYLLKVEGGDDMPLFISLKQVNEEPRLPIGFKLYSMTDGVPIPLDLRAAWNDKSFVADINGANVFVVAYEAHSNYMLKPGTYMLVPFTDKKGTEKKFALTFATTQGASFSHTAFNTA